jgi:hypothetical protein
MRGRQRAYTQVSLAAGRKPFIVRTRSIRIALAAVACACAAALPASAGNDKQLANLKGSVSFSGPSGTGKTLALNATVALADKDYAMTGDASEAAVDLADSSRVLVGSATKVQLAFFNQVQGNNAKFVVYDGKVRFMVQHPAGAKANYTFQTPTGTIAVRGTEGDIQASNSSLQVNVYEVCDPNQPVVVTATNGQRYTLVPGQSFVAQYVNGILQTRVEQLTQAMIDQFSPEFGVPSSWDAAKGEVVGYATNQVAGAVNNATNGYGSTLVNQAVGGLFKKKATPTPSASPASQTCNHS